MSRQTGKQGDCGREPCAKECALSALGLDPIEEQLLAISRHVFQSFATPGTQGWLYGLKNAQGAFGHDGPQLFARIVETLQAIRCARTSCFLFNSPMCTCCSQVVTEHERRLMVALAAIRRGQMGVARTELMMLCEGAETGSAIHALVSLSRCCPAPEASLTRTEALQ